MQLLCLDMIRQASLVLSMELLVWIQLATLLLSAHDSDVEVCLVKAERYLIQVLKKGSSTQSMNKLRYSMYQRQNCCTSQPPTTVTLNKGLHSESVLLRS